MGIRGRVRVYDLILGELGCSHSRFSVVPNISGQVPKKGFLDVDYDEE